MRITQLEPLIRMLSFEDLKSTKNNIEHILRQYNSKLRGINELELVEEFKAQLIVVNDCLKKYN